MIWGYMILKSKRSKNKEKKFKGRWYKWKFTDCASNIARLRWQIGNSAYRKMVKKNSADGGSKTIISKGKKETQLVLNQNFE